MTTALTTTPFNNLLKCFWSFGLLAALFTAASRLYSYAFLLQKSAVYFSFVTTAALSINCRKVTSISYSFCVSHFMFTAINCSTEISLQHFYSISLYILCNLYARHLRYSFVTFPVESCYFTVCDDRKLLVKVCLYFRPKACSLRFTYAHHVLRSYALDRRNEFCLVVCVYYCKLPHVLPLRLTKTVGILV